MIRKKIFNDPVYGFISIPRGLILNLVDHPYFQRLRRISQVGFTYLVYPGALHTRFHHALGAFHLMTQAIDVLRSKGVEITDEEAQGVSIAILLHDIGHGPFSHALEHALIDLHHEDLSILFMEELNDVFDGQLDMAIEIFTNKYPKKFLYQLVSGQLDMDRMDYLNRDSFFTGVYEGVIGYDRIIKMLDVRDERLVVEEKGIYSIEKFLIARRLMYWQVYLHKTCLGAEQMLIHTLKRAKELVETKKAINISKNLAFFMNKQLILKDFSRKELLDNFSSLDDVDILAALKSFQKNKDLILSYLATSILNRNLFKTELKRLPFTRDYLESVRLKITAQFDINPEDLDYLVYHGSEENNAYNPKVEEINILFRNGKIKPISTLPDNEIPTKIITKHFLCYPKKII